MLKHLLVGAFTLSSLAFAGPHGAAPVAPAAGAPSFFEGRSDREQRDDRRDLRKAERLLAAFDDALARRDGRALSEVERRFERYLADERAEARFDRRLSRRLDELDFRLQRLSGRMHPRALVERREVYVKLVRLAERDARRG
ncbi:MAG: hypothetical protein ACOZQL_17410 [Myxococcota bacterium]